VVYSTSDVSDSARKAVAKSEELKRSTLLRSFASVHMWAFAEKTGRMGDLPVSLCFCNLWALPASAFEYDWTWAVRCRLLPMGSSKGCCKVVVTSLSVCCYTCTVADGPCVNVKCESRSSLAWCCSQTQRSQQLPMISLVFLM